MTLQFDSKLRKWHGPIECGRTSIFWKEALMGPDEKDVAMQEALLVLEKLH
jgi:hypothetical protein